MKNSIVVTIPFDFKGEHHTPSITIDLDNFIASKKELSEIYATVAVSNNIGPYSYEYEVLMSSEMRFSTPTGIAGDYLNGTEFDLDAFSNDYQDHKRFQTLQAIAQENLQIEDLEQHPNLKQALLDACKFGEGLAR